MFSLSQTGNRAAYLAVRGYMGYINTVDFGLADPRYISEFSATFLSFSGKKDAGCCNVLKLSIKSRGRLQDQNTLLGGGSLPLNISYRTCGTRLLR